MPPDKPDQLGRALLPLRAFLGVTFCFAGLQKLANPGFFDVSDPRSIQAQLAGAARTSPIHGLVSPLGHVAIALGVIIALGELAIGVGTLLGLWARIAAAGGIVLSLMLFLTVSFRSAPYYTGADIVFVFAWTPLLLAGAGSVLSADAAIAARALARDGQAGTSRREVVLKGSATVAGAAAAVSMAVAGLTAGLGRLASNGAAGQANGTNPLPKASGEPGTRQPASRGGIAIGPASDVPVGHGATFTDPATGDPSIVIQLSAGDFVAYDAVCPHAGCTVRYSQPEQKLICPCHGSEFSRATGAVEAGPADRGLTRIRIAPGPGGQLYVS